MDPLRPKRLPRLLFAVLWWIGGVAFLAGVYLFELLGERWWRAGALR